MAIDQGARAEPAVPVARPGRRVASAPATLALGVASLALTLLGPLGVIVVQGLTPFGPIADSLSSPPALVSSAIGLVLGGAGVAWGLALRGAGPAERSRRHAVGALWAGLALAPAVPVVVILVHTLTPYQEIVRAFLSTPTLALLLGGAVLGVVAIVWGFSSYGQMPTKRMRERAIAGAVLGIQALVLGGLLLAFRNLGNPERFVFHFFNLEVVSGFVGEFLRAAGNTLLLAVVGELGGVVLGLLLAVLSLSKRPVVRAPARVYINFFRGTPLIWQLSVFYFGLALGLGLRLDLDLGPLQLSAAYVTAMIVFILNTGAYASEVFRAGIQSIERGQMEAARSLGMSYGQAMRYAIVPQAVRRVIPPLMNEFVILIKDTSLIVVLGLLPQNYDLYTQAREGYADSFNATFFTAAAIGYLVVTLPLIRAVNAVEKRLRSGLVGVGA